MIYKLESDKDIGMSQSQTKIDLPADWLSLIEDQFKLDYMKNLRSFLISEKKSGKTIYPPNQDIFRVFKEVSLNDVRVVILGQDPYHGPGQAHGLSFSVPDQIAIPPSLRNIYKEFEADLNLRAPKSGNLRAWVQQGVLLLNTVLTVEAGNPASHQNKGWELFTDCVIQRLSSHHNLLVFVLWGAHALKKTPLIDTSKHVILQAPHPSPLSAHRGFFGSKPFSKINTILLENKIQPIRWDIICEK